MAICCICCSSLNVNIPTISTECGHVFHKNCIYTWLGTNSQCPTCPSCRQKVHPNRLRRIHLDFSENTILSDSIVQDLQSNAFNMADKLAEMERKLLSAEKKNSTLLKTKELYQDRASKLKQEVNALKIVNNDLNKKLVNQTKQMKFFQQECYVMTSQMQEIAKW